MRRFNFTCVLLATISSTICWFCESRLDADIVQDHFANPISASADSNELDSNGSVLDFADDASVGFVDSKRLMDSRAKRFCNQSQFSGNMGQAFEQSQAPVGPAIGAVRFESLELEFNSPKSLKSDEPESIVVGWLNEFGGGPMIEANASLGLSNSPDVRVNIEVFNYVIAGSYLESLPSQDAQVIYADCFSYRLESSATWEVMHTPEPSMFWFKLLGISACVVSVLIRNRVAFPG